MKRLSIYDEMQRSDDEEFLIEELGDQEADDELERLETAYARFLRGTYRTWSRSQQYAFDRRASLFACLQNRRLLVKLAIGEFDGLVGDELVAFTRSQAEALKSNQISLVKLRIGYHAASASGSA